MIQHIIVTGGVGAGKTRLTDTFVTEHNALTFSPAEVLKMQLSKVLAKGWGQGRPDGLIQHNEPIGDLADELFFEMNDRVAKNKYRELLQAYGEYFSNQDPYYWINQVMSAVQEKLVDTNPPLVVYDSIRRPEEIKGIKREFPEAKRVHLDVSFERQFMYQTSYLGNSPEQAKKIISHPSERWLDDITDPELLPNIVVGVDGKADREVYDTVVRMLDLWKNY